MGLVNVDLNNASLDDANFDNSDPETISYDRLMIWWNGYKQRKTSKKETTKD